MWCERKDFTREHIIGHQVAKALDVTPPVKSYWGDFVMPGDKGEVYIDDRVCDTCNRNWMRKLDNKVMQFMRPSIRHEARVQIEAGQQELLAMWATKVALLL